MELRHLRAFRAIMQTGSTVEAAQLLGVSQPSVSRLLAEFEAATGEALFIRANGRLMAREAAELMLPEVERALAGVEGLSRKADIRAAPLRIAAPAGVVTRIFGPALQRLHQELPSQRFLAEILSYYEVVGAVASGRSDIGFVKGPVEHPALQAIDLVTVGSDVVMPFDHPLTKKDELTPADLTHQPLILLGRNRPFRVQLDQLFQQARIKPNILIETQAVSSACSFVRQGLGLSIANSLLARAEAIDGLTWRPFKANFTHQFQLAHLRQPDRRRAIAMFAGHVEDVVRGIIQGDLQRR